MTAPTLPPVVLRPGQASLADWRAVYRGSPVSLDPISRCDVEAGAAALEAVLAREGGPAPPEAGDAPLAADVMASEGDILPVGLLRLLVALKLASLSQGTSGVRWSLVDGIAGLLGCNLLPAIPARDANDRLAGSYLFAALTGIGEVVAGERRRAAAKALKKAGLAPLRLTEPEKAAVVSGAELSTALALAGLFETERVFQSALVAGALAGAAVPAAALHPRVHRLSRQAGQMAVAAALRSLADPLPTAPNADTADLEARHFPARMGACLDLLRQAGETLERAANAASGERLVFWQSEEIVAGAPDISSVSLAADLAALALREIAALAARQSTLLTEAQDGAETGGNPRRATLLARAAEFNAQIAERAISAGCNGRGVQRLLPMAGSAALVVALAVLGTRGGDGVAAEGPGLDDVQRVVAAALPPAEEAGLSADEFAAAAELVRSGALAAAAGLDLPGLGPLPQRHR